MCNDLTLLQARLLRIEAEYSIRQCMTDYMRLCDDVSKGRADDLKELFSDDAIWEGVGERYSALFGRIEGKSEIHKMFKTYETGQPHFRLNYHFLTAESVCIQPCNTKAEGEWMMLQTSTLNNNQSYLNAAKIQATFCLQDKQWVISHFKTRNLFSKPVDAWDSAELFSVPK